MEWREQPATDSVAPPGGIWQVVTAMKAYIQISLFEAHQEPEIDYGITTSISRVTLE